MITRTSVEPGGVDVFERSIYKVVGDQMISEELSEIPAVIRTSAQEGCVLVDITQTSIHDKGWDRGPNPTDAKKIVVKGLFQAEIFKEKRIRAPALLQIRQKDKAIKKMAQLIIDKRQQTRS